MRDLAIAYGSSCTAKKWSNKTISFNDLCKRLATTVRTPETVEEYRKMKRSEKDDAKDKGGFVGGKLKGGRRKRETVISRSMFSGDVDRAKAGFIEEYEMLSPYTSVLYTTHGHTPENPRIRIIVPFTRDVSPDEYQAIGRYFAAEWGIDQFDECSYRPHQLMYWPTTPSNGEYICRTVDGEWLDPDQFLSAHPDWRDCSLLPTSSRESGVRKNDGKKLEDPEEKAGLVGVFCRTYSVREAIEKFLSDVYEPAAIPGRFQYKKADSASGVQIFDDKFAHSFHASDPACGRSLNAFDIVRIHKFGDEDEKESFKRMCEFVQTLDEVKVKIAEEREAEANVEFEDWRTRLRYQPRSKILENSVWNLRLILENDEDYSGFAYNEMAGRVQVTGKMPWDRPKNNKFWRDADTAQLKSELDEKYVPFSSRNHDVAFTKVADDRSFHPIRDYLDGLPSWDGVKRVETVLVDCLEAEDTPYTRTVTRKTFAAAVARIYRPGIKFDSVLVFDGEQGIGKSTLFKELVGDEFYSETLSLTDMNDKSGAEKLQGFWIAEIAELAGMKKADIEKVKAFLSTSDDKYRPSYGRTVESHPRQCIIIASVNGERGYLRDITGNRRFWVVKLKQTGLKKEWVLDRDQIWAEAKAIWESGEKLYLEGDMVKEAETAQKGAMEEDERKGIVEEYLNTLLPANWDDMDLYERRSYLNEKDRAAVRKDLVKKLEEITGVKPRYSGMPKCEYTAEGFTIDRAGDLLAEDDADQTVITKLIEGGLVAEPETEETTEQEAARQQGETAEPETSEQTEEPEPETTEEPEQEVAVESEPEETVASEQTGEPVEDIDLSVNFQLPLDGHTGVTLRNLVNLIYSRGPMVSKAAGAAIHVSGGLVEALKEDSCTYSMANFRKAYGEYIAAHEDAVQGFELLEDRISFNGFPAAPDTEHFTAWGQLVALMNHQALSQKRIQAKRIDDSNEKYSFRVWLVRIGMNGPEFKETRKILLKNLSGHSAFRTEEQAQKAREKGIRKRGELRAEEAPGRVPAEGTSPQTKSVHF